MKPTLMIARRHLGSHIATRVVLVMTVVTVGLPLAVTAPPFAAFGTQSEYLHQFANAGVFILLALGLNIVVGYAGLLDLGFAAFFALGAYTYAFGASGFSGAHLPILLLLPAGAAIAALFGVILGSPTLRLRGDYLAIVTFGFGEIVPIVFLNAKQQTGGPSGIGGLDRPELFGLRFGVLDPAPYYVAMAVVVTLVLVAIFRMEHSKLGRAWAAIREDELAAASAGVNAVATKLLAFALGAAIGGFAGVLNAAKLSVVSPDQFLFSVSVTALAMIVLGGMGNVWGVMLGAFGIFMIQAVALKQLNVLFADVPILQDIDFVQYQFLLLGIALVVMMLARPAGVFPSRLRRQELAPALVPAEQQTPVAVASATGEDPVLDQAVVGELASDEEVERPAASPLIKATGISKRFGGLIALAGLDLDLEPGSISSIIGPNGAGKTTFFDILAGVAEPTAGRITIDGRPLIERSRRAWLEPIVWVAPAIGLGSLAYPILSQLGLAQPFSVSVVVTLLALTTLLAAGLVRPHWYQRMLALIGIFRPSRPNDLVVAGVARTFQNIRLFENLSALDNVLVGAHARLPQTLVDAVLRTRRFTRNESVARRDAMDLLSLVGLQAHAFVAARNLSYGDQRRLELARALASRPRVLLLDEPTAGMNPVETEAMTVLIAALRRQFGLTILLIEHDMDVVMGISDRVTVLDHGVKIAEGSPAEVRSNPLVVEAYLGTEDEDDVA